MVPFANYLRASKHLLKLIATRKGCVLSGDRSVKHVLVACGWGLQYHDALSQALKSSPLMRWTSLH